MKNCERCPLEDTNECKHCKDEEEKRRTKDED